MNEVKKLSDSEWVNVVNAPEVLACGGGHAAEDAVAKAFNLIEDRLIEKNQPILDELQSRLESLEKDANECRVSLLTQIHELSDHIERAAPCCGDADMREQMMGQREFALMVSGKWNQNGNPFTAMQANKGE